MMSMDKITRTRATMCSSYRHNLGCAFRKAIKMIVIASNLYYTEQYGV